MLQQNRKSLFNTLKVVNYKNVYTGIGRAQEQLYVISPNPNILNSCVLNYGYLVYQNLAASINSLLPESMTEQLKIENDEDEKEISDDFDFMDDDFEDMMPDDDLDWL